MRVVEDRCGSGRVCVARGCGGRARRGRRVAERLGDQPACRIRATQPSGAVPVVDTGPLTRPRGTTDRRPPREVDRRSVRGLGGAVHLGRKRHEPRAHGAEHAPATFEGRSGSGQPDAIADSPGRTRERARQRGGARKAPARHPSAHVPRHQLAGRPHSPRCAGRRSPRCDHGAARSVPYLRGVNLLQRQGLLRDSVGACLPRGRRCPCGGHRWQGSPLTRPTCAAAELRRSARFVSFDREATSKAGRGTRDSPV